MCTVVVVRATTARGKNKMRVHAQLADGSSQWTLFQFLEHTRFRLYIRIFPWVHLMYLHSLYAAGVSTTPFSCYLSPATEFLSRFYLFISYHRLRCTDDDDDDDDRVITIPRFEYYYLCVQRAYANLWL